LTVALPKHESAILFLFYFIPNFPRDLMNSPGGGDKGNRAFGAPLDRSAPFPGALPLAVSVCLSALAAAGRRRTAWVAFGFGFGF
jgi:hypothetical protein